MMKSAIDKVLSGEDLAVDEAKGVMDSIMDGQATPAQIKDILVALKDKGEKPDEVAGFVQSMRDHSVRIKLRNPNAVDSAGTGGDGSHSFNISTAAGIVASAAGVTVAKHGNRSVSSSCGSADLLEATGAQIDPGPERVAEAINEIGFGFMFAPRFHPAMKHAVGPRKELGVRTVFNILGPMTNPAGVKRQLIGVYEPELMPLMAEVLAATGSKHVVIAHSQDGMDEFSVSAPTDYLEKKDGATSRHTISPEDVGLEEHPAGSLRGGEAAENKAILLTVLNGDKGACRDAVLFNAGAMIYVAGRVDDIKDGVTAAAEAIDSGTALFRLNQWVAFTQD